jgi:hypothetical protein
MRDMGNSYGVMLENLKAGYFLEGLGVVRGIVTCMSDY